MTDTATQPLRLTPDDYHVIGPDDFGIPGLWARESVGPNVAVEAIGPLVTVHDSRFDPHRGIGHHPHQRMERLFYILEGTVDHDDALNDITGHMGTGDLGILTEGRRGMLHSEWNNTDGSARAYILVYPCDPLPPTAAFDAIRDSEASRAHPSPGVETKHVVQRDCTRLHGDVHEFSDSSVDEGAALDVHLDPDESGLLFLVDGAFDLENNGTAAIPGAGREHTVLIPPAPQPRKFRLLAREPSRVLGVIAGLGFGFRRHA